MKIEDITDVSFADSSISEIVINDNVVWRRPPKLGASVLAMEDDTEVVIENEKHTIRVV